MEKAPTITVGTIVKLKSGGPDMTVQEVCQRYDTKELTGSVDCQWFAGKKLEKGRFPVDSLEVSPETRRE